MRVCPDCGCKNGDVVEVCGWCGRDVSMVEVSEAPSDRRYSFKMTPRQRIYLSWGIMLVGGICGFNVLGFLLFLTAVFVRPYRVKLKSWKFVGVSCAALFLGMFIFVLIEPMRGLLGFYLFGWMVIYDLKAGYVETEGSCLRED